MSSRVFAAAVALGILLPTLPARALPAPRKIVDYDIQVALDESRRELSGSETLRWTNPSDLPVNELKFHLYWNAFRNNRSTLFRESGGRLRDDQADPEAGFGSIDLTSMTRDGVDLLRNARFESPDDGNPDDRTVLSVPLPTAAAPGETIVLVIAWKSRIPRVFARAGYVRDFYMIGQWYPKIGVLEPRGRRRRTEAGWNCHQYHANSEFYADWGDYRVAITLPERYVVASAGALVKETRGGGKKTLVFEQASIHDFAWSADPRYVVRGGDLRPGEGRPARRARPGRRAPRQDRGRAPGRFPSGEAPFLPAAGPRVAGIAVRRRPEVGSRLVRALCVPLSLRSGELRRPTGGRSGGDGDGVPDPLHGRDVALPRPVASQRPQEDEVVVVHEFGHGYWYGLLASNEFEESWMDEGITSFTEYEMMDRRYGGEVSLPFGERLGSFDLGRLRSVFTARETDRLVTRSWEFASSRSYGRNSYARAATAVDQVRRLLGEETFWRAFRAYAERWRFDHPSTEDFLDAFRAVAGARLEPLIREDLVRERNGRLRGHAGRRAPRSSPSRGTTTRGRRIVAPKKSPSAEKAVDRGGTKSYESVALVSRTGTIPLPVEVVLTFENGATWKTTWDGQARWLRLRTTYRSRLAKAEVDPGRKVVLDANPWNNARAPGRMQGPSAAAKVRAYALHGVQILLSSLWLLRLTERTR